MLCVVEVIVYQYDIDRQVILQSSRKHYDLMALCCQGESGEEWVIIFKYGRRLERPWECSFYFECDLRLLGKQLSVIFRRPFGCTPGSE